MRITRSDGPAGYVGYVEGTIPAGLFERVQAAGMTDQELQRVIEAGLEAACDYQAWTAAVRCTGTARGDGYPGTRFFHDDAECPGHGATAEREV